MSSDLWKIHVVIRWRKAAPLPPMRDDSIHERARLQPEIIWKSSLAAHSLNDGRWSRNYSPGGFLGDDLKALKDAFCDYLAWFAPRRFR